jgi:hypothetical protein
MEQDTKNYFLLFSPARATVIRLDKKKHENIQQCITLLQRKEETQSDLITKAIDVIMNPDGSIKMPALSPASIPMTTWAHNQMAKKMDIPNGYYNRMLKEDKPLLADNVNRWLREGGNLMVRTEGGTARAILSSKYKIVQNRLVLLTVMDALQTMHRPYIVRSLSESDTTFYAKFVGSETYDIGNDDLYRGGIVVRNSEIGGSRLQVDLFVSRLSCGNDAIFGDEGISKIHIGRKLEAGIVDFQSDTIEADNLAMMKSIRDITMTAFDPAGIQHIYDTIKLAKDNIQGQTSQTIRAIQSQHKFSDELTDRLLTAIQGHSQYDIAQSITFNAQGAANEDDRIALEELGGAILVMPANEFNRTYKPAKAEGEEKGMLDFA